MTTRITPRNSALFLLDFQNVHANRVPDADELLVRAATAAATAREHGMLVINCRVAFTEEESKNLPPCFARLASNPAHIAAYNIDAPTSQFHFAVAPKEGDLNIIKKRVGPFQNAPIDLHSELQGRGINTLVVGGIATGGAVLSTIVQASELDYNLYLLEDACADPDPDTHLFLLDFLGKRAERIKCTDFRSRIYEACKLS